LKKKVQTSNFCSGFSIPLSNTTRLKVFDLKKTNAIKPKMITTTINISSFSKAFKARNGKLEIKQIQYKT